MTLYPGRSLPLAPEDFRQPGAAYRGAPFWAWNTRLDTGKLLAQIDAFRQMGFGGFHIHARTGLDTPYLGEDFMAAVRACVDKAQREGLRAWLYDEDRWPSGFGGGLVTREERHRAKYLLFTPRPYGTGAEPPPLASAAVVSRAENGHLLARYDVILEDGRLASSRRLGEGEEARGQVWYAYLETMRPTPWWNGQAYVDTLSPEATARFLEVTHGRYVEVVGDHFGGTVRTMFTDEPQCIHKGSLPRPDALEDVTLPWTSDFGETYRAAYGTDPLDTLPEVLWEGRAGTVSVHRYRYHDHVAGRFTTSYADPLGAWCDAHGLLLTGHLMEEATLHGQTRAVGEIMRPLRAFGLPGIDMLCDQREYTTAKQAQSVARQSGREGVLSELYGVTDWDFSFAGHKNQGDWQAALGVTARVPHLAWASMAGEAKRDYPASIFTQSPWWREYPLVEDHFARLGTVLTRGSAHVRVGVIHPVESFWLAFGPGTQTAEEQARRETEFRHLTEWLLFGLIDFDFIAESLLPVLAGEPNGETFRVGQARYDVIIVPGLRTLRASTRERLERFRDAGGPVIFLGNVPDHEDALPSPRPGAVALRSACLPFERGPLLHALEECRDVRVTGRDGQAADHLLHQVRLDGPRRHVFLCNTDPTHSLDRARVSFRGVWTVTALDTLTGDQRGLGARVEDGWTILTWDFPASGHLLVTLEPGPGEPLAEPVPEEPREVARLTDPLPVTLSEPNTLLLDAAEFRLDGGPWREQTEVLRLDTALRRELGWPLRMEALAQPWTLPAPPPSHVVTLRFSVQVGEAVQRPILALEDAERVTIRLDGTPVPSDVTGWWVDEAIETVALPPLAAGRRELTLHVPFGPRTNLEWVYLLGDFGVELSGREARLTAPVRSLSFGDWTRQGLPFYTGNVTYHGHFTSPEGHLTVEAPQFRGTLVGVHLDGMDAGRLAFAPYRADLGVVEAGPHRLDLTVYGHRFNVFGCLHNAQPDLLWVGPNAWRSAGAHWTDGYRLKPLGLLQPPGLLKR